MPVSLQAWALWFWLKSSMIVNIFGLKYIDADIRNQVRAVYSGLVLQWLAYWWLVSITYKSKKV